MRNDSKLDIQKLLLIKHLQLLLSEIATQNYIQFNTAPNALDQLNADIQASVKL